MSFLPSRGLSEPRLAQTEIILGGRDRICVSCLSLSSQVNNALLISQGALSTLGLLLLDVAEAVQRNNNAGLELVSEDMPLVGRGLLYIYWQLPTSLCSWHVLCFGV